ncbi:hypothetical protein A2U01_0015053 [Trifolium medium]|uniref:Uncharacterized protein n=1 Tax=Trifolium medium TaxID=97028 RepID=A0A392N541_9FABA|nr:hypothetical protein [Trifolium medium]
MGTLGMTPLERIEDIFGGMQATHMKGLSLAAWGQNSIQE